ncbi:MAG: hypothetical protein L0Y60_17755, partial [Beijerinckiaceae bacterium]|nr:hypothetical protein [Beijerinckiaceae bacterium]
SVEIATNFTQSNDKFFAGKDHWLRASGPQNSRVAPYTWQGNRPIALAPGKSAPGLTLGAREECRSAPQPVT